MEAEEAAKARTRRIWKQKKLWYEKMMKAVDRGIDNLADLEKLEEQERQAGERECQAARAFAAGLSGVTADLKVVAGNDRFLNGFDWDAIPANPFGVTGKIFSKGVGRLLSAQLVPMYFRHFYIHFT